MSGLKARLLAVENVFDKEHELTVVRVYGGVSFYGDDGTGVVAHIGNFTLSPADDESFAAFKARAEKAAIEAGERRIVIMGLHRDLEPKSANSCPSVAPGV